jgi:ABC-type transport system involved in cytochrome c biogenesis permease subunit
MTLSRNSLLAWLAGLLALVGAVVYALPHGKVRGFDVVTVAKLPVLESGRVKPLDSVSRNALLMIRSKSSVYHQGRFISADEWMLDMLFRPASADQQPVFVIDNPEVLGLLGIQQTSGRYYTFDAIRPRIQEVEAQAKVALAVDARARTPFQSGVVNLFEKIYLYYKLQHTMEIPGEGTLAAELVRPAGPDSASRREALAQLGHFRILPPLSGPVEKGWNNTGEALQAMARGAQRHPGLEPLARLGSSYAVGDPEGFNRAAADLRSLVLSVQPGAQSHADHEIIFNRAEPFFIGMAIYVLAFCSLALSWLWKKDLFQPAAFALMGAGAIIHTAGLAYRIILQGRPPVTNLYSSAIFVGWGVVILGLVLEYLYRKGFATAVASLTGFASLIVAHHLSMDGDTMTMMAAVLDSNFWLATHVITITIGYSGTFLAGAIAIGYTIWKHAVPKPDPETAKSMVDMAYGIICFSLLFSFVGTVLGGIWADQSWGRFWGWDPKENGALLIVLWCAIILHARWAGYAREKGIMAMAIFGNIITSFSWFGVNMLGVGLHSYGFMDKAFWALAIFMASQALFIVLCLSPRFLWLDEQTPQKG